jgi:hypothetical protein
VSCVFPRFFHDIVLTLSKSQAYFPSCRDSKLPKSDIADSVRGKVRTFRAKIALFRSPPFPSSHPLYFSPSRNDLSRILARVSLSTDSNRSTRQSFYEMSSTTSPQIPSNRGRCVVCGEESHLRCSECAKHGTDWMFFCSEKHQMLVSEISLIFSPKLRKG